MHTIRVDNIEVYDAIDLKNQLIRAGLVLDKDFKWTWVTAAWDSNNGWTRQKHVEFEFTDPTLATFYQLKWS
jgi:hypothetical protein